MTTPTILDGLMRTLRFIWWVVRNCRRVTIAIYRLWQSTLLTSAFRAYPKGAPDDRD